MENSKSSTNVDVENWKRQMISETSLNRMIAKDFSLETFVAGELKKGYDLSEMSELQSKMQQLKTQLVTSLDVSLQRNYLHIISDMQKIKDFSLPMEQNKDKMLQLQKSLISLHGMFTQNYETVRNGMPLLQNAKEAAQLVQRSIKFMQNLKILRQLVSAKLEINDLVKTSLVLHEISLHSGFLTDMSFYENSKGFLQQVKDEVLKRAEKKFSDALLQKNQVEISLSIQIFFHLGMLAEILEARANQSLKGSNQAWRQILTREYAGEYTGSLFVQIKNQLTEDYSNAQQMWLLNQSVKASRDPSSMESYETFLAGKNVLKLFELFWNKQHQIIGQSLQKIQENPRFQANYKTIVSCYPKLFGFLENFASNFNEYVLTFPDSVISYDFPDLKSKLLATLSIISVPYFNQLQSKLQAISTKLLVHLSSLKKQNFSIMFGAIQSELDHSLLGEFNFQTKENFSPCALIFGQSSSIFLKEGKKFVEDYLASFNLKQLTIGESFGAIYTFSTLKQMLKNLLAFENNEFIDLQLYDETSEALSNVISSILQSSYLPVMTSYIHAFLSVYFQPTDKKQPVRNVKQSFSQLQQYLSLYSPFAYQEKSSLFDSQFFACFSGIIERFLRDYCFVMIASFECATRTEELETNLGQEIEAMTSLLEQPAAGCGVDQMKVVIRLQKIFLMDWKHANDYIPESIPIQTSEFYYYLKHGMLQVAILTRLETITNAQILVNRLDIKTFDQFESQFIHKVFDIIQQYLMVHKDTLSSTPEYKFLVSHSNYSAINN